jgi:hypothetical protein
LKRAFAVCAFFTCALAVRADARTTLDIRAGTLDFYSDVLALVAHDRVVATIGGRTIVADYAYIDVYHDRAVFGGDVHLRFGEGDRAFTTLAVDIDAISGTGITAEETPRVLALALLDPHDESVLDALPTGDAFTVTAFDGRSPYIRARHAVLNAHASLRLTPAAFPSNLFAPPAPTFLYSLAANPNLTTSTLPAATFDQPLNVAGGKNALLAAHLRYLEGTGGVIAFDEHLVDGDRAYAVASIDAPARAAQTLGLSAYQRMSDTLTQSIDTTRSYGLTAANYAFNAEVGQLYGRLAVTQVGASGTIETSLRTHDRPLFGGATYRLLGAYGLDHNPFGELNRKADPLNYPLLFRTSLRADVALPLVRGPFGTSVSATLSDTQTWYAYPRSRNSIGGAATISKRFSRALFGNASVSTNFFADDYGAAQLKFYPPTPVVLPDGTKWFGADAYRGFSTSRTYSLDLYLTPRPATDVRLNLTRTNDFPQFNGYGRPITVARVDVRFRPIPNLGIAIGRSDQFGWGGVTFSRWSLSVTP